MRYLFLIPNLLFCRDSEGGGHLNSLADASYRPQTGANTNLAMNYLPERNGGLLKNHSAMSGAPPNSHGGRSVGRGGFGSYGANGGGSSGGRSGRGRGGGGFGGGGAGSNAGGYGYGGNGIGGGRKGMRNNRLANSRRRGGRGFGGGGHSPGAALQNAAAMGDPRAMAAMNNAANKVGFGGGARSRPGFGISSNSPAALAAAANQGAREGEAAARAAAGAGAGPGGAGGGAGVGPGGPASAARNAARAAAGAGAGPGGIADAARAAGGLGGAGGGADGGPGGGGFGGGVGSPGAGRGAGGRRSGGGGGEHVPPDPPLTPAENEIADALEGGPTAAARRMQKAREAGTSNASAGPRAAAKQAMRPIPSGVRDETKKAIAQQEAMDDLQNQRDVRATPDNIDSMNRNPMSDGVAASSGAQADADRDLSDLPPSRKKAAMKAKQVGDRVGDAAGKEAEAMAAANPDVSPAEAKMAGAEAAEEAENAVADQAKKEQEVERDALDREKAREAGDAAEYEMTMKDPDSTPSQRQRAGAAAAATKQAELADKRAAEEAEADAAEAAGAGAGAGAGAAAAAAAAAAGAAARGRALAAAAEAAEAAPTGRGALAAAAAAGAAGQMAEAAEEGAAEGRKLGKGHKKRAAQAAAAAGAAADAAEAAEAMENTPKRMRRAAAEGAAEGIAAANDAKDISDMADAASQGAKEGVAAAQQAKDAEREHQKNKMMKDPQMRRAGAEGAEQGIAGAKAAKSAAAAGGDAVAAAQDAIKKEAAMQEVAKSPEAVAAVQEELEEEAEALDQMAKKDPHAAIQKSILSGDAFEQAAKKGESVAAKNAIDDAKAFIDRTKPILQADQALEEACDSAEAARNHGFIAKEEAEMKIEEAMIKGTQAAEQAALDRQNSEEGLGIIATVPDDADKVSIENSSLKLPLKSFVDVEAKNEEEAVALARQTELKDALRNKVTNKEIESPLNVIRGEDGFFNVAESAKELEIKEGTVIYPESAREAMRNAGLDTSKLEHQYNTGQRTDVPLGRGYYSADAAGTKMTIPSPANPSPSKALIGEQGALDTSYGEGLEIKKGTLHETPWSDFAKSTRPTLHSGIKKRPYLSKADEQMLKKAIATKELLQNTRTEVLRNPNGEDYVELTPPYGVAEKVSVEDAIVNLNSPPKGLKDTGQDGVGLLQGTDTTGFAASEDAQGAASMNIADKPDFVGSVEDQVIGNSFGNAAISGTAKDTLTVVNAFTGEIDQDKKGLVVSDEEKLKISGQEATIEMIRNNLLENSAVKAEKIGVTESSYINAINSISNSALGAMTEYAMHPMAREMKLFYETTVVQEFSTLLQNKGPKLGEVIFDSIKVLSGLPNPANLFQAPVKEITAIVHNGNNPKEAPKIEKIFVNKSNVSKVDPAYVPKPEMVKEKPGISRKPELKVNPELLATHPKTAQVIGVSKVDSAKLPPKEASNTVQVIDSKAKPPQQPNTPISSTVSTSKPSSNQTQTQTINTNRYVPQNQPGKPPQNNNSNKTTTVLGVSPVKPIGQR